MSKKQMLFVHNARKNVIMQTVNAFQSISPAASVHYLHYFLKHSIKHHLIVPISHITALLLC